MGYDKGFCRRFFSGCLVSLGMALAACQSTEAGSVMAIEEEGEPSRHIVKKIVGGVVMKVLPHPGSRSVALLIRETRLSSSGRPLCQEPTGRILSLAKVQALFRGDPGRLRSAMVVTGDPDTPSLSGIHPGSCVSVAPDEIERSSTVVRSTIEIETPSLARGEDNLGKGIVEVWGTLAPPRTMTAKVKKTAGPRRKTLSRARPATPFSLHLMEQPA
ncbi:MAG: hypothetical protein M1313_09265 [Nitrospirae bacterium]|nr:hypothetical protein [Nitrospirota bacterium]